MSQLNSPFRARLVFLGASNLVRDFPTVVVTARETLAPVVGRGPVRIFCAAGHGRSFGTWSRVFGVRGLPGIARCGIWPALEDQLGRERGPHPPTYALLTDIGNDIAYGAEPGDIAGWVETCLERLARLEAIVALILLPLDSLRRLSPWKLRLLRLLLFPTHPISSARVRRHTEELQYRLRDLAASFGARALEPDAGWFGPDRIHFRPGQRRQAWRTMLGLWNPQGRPDPETFRGPRLSRLAWWTLTPERWRLAGVELGRIQPARSLADGSEVWLY